MPRIHWRSKNKENRNLKNMVDKLVREALKQYCLEYTNSNVLVENNYKEQIKKLNADNQELVNSNYEFKAELSKKDLLINELKKALLEFEDRVENLEEENMGNKKKLKEYIKTIIDNKSIIEEQKKELEKYKNELVYYRKKYEEERDYKRVSFEIWQY